MVYTKKKVVRVFVAVQSVAARVLARLSILTEVVREIKLPLIRGTRWWDRKDWRRPKKEK